MAARWDKGGKDYINCPMDKAQYDAFVAALNDGEKTEFKEWEKDTPYFEGCMPIEVMAERGVETLRFGPMKGVGLDNPHTLRPNIRPGAGPMPCVQLRQDNALGTLWNMVGFQTKLKHAEQVRIFRTIPGLENAEFARLGGIHRNSFIRSPELLDRELRLKSLPHIRFAGQITGCEGYVESAAIGLLAARFAAAESAGPRPRRRRRPKPRSARCSAHITGGADRRNLSADEHQFRPDAAARGPQGQERRPQETLHRPRARSAARAGSSANAARRAKPLKLDAHCVRLRGSARESMSRIGPRQVALSGTLDLRFADRTRRCRAADRPSTSPGRMRSPIGRSSRIDMSQWRVSVFSARPRRRSIAGATPSRICMKSCR